MKDRESGLCHNEQMSSKLIKCQSFGEKEVITMTMIPCSGYIILTLKDADKHFVYKLINIIR